MIFISILAAVSLIHITSAVREIKSSFLCRYTHLLKSKFSPVFVEFVIWSESSDRRPFALRSRIRHVTVSFSLCCCLRSCWSLSKCHCCQAPRIRCINVPFSWQYSERLYERIYVNKALAIDHHPAQMHSSGRETGEHTPTLKSPQFSWIWMSAGKHACQYHLLRLAAVVYICAAFSAQQGGREESMMEGAEREKGREREQHYWVIGSCTITDRGFTDWSIDRLPVQTEPGWCLCRLGPAFPSLPNAKFSRSALHCARAKQRE